MIKKPKSHHKPRDRNSANRQNQDAYGNVTSPLVEWFLVQKTGTIAFKLNPHCVILIGSKQCDINIQSPSVEKRHAVLCFDPNSDRFSVKDLNSRNGTFLNNRRISPTDRPEKLNNMDLLRFGYDSNLYEIRLGSASGPGVQQNEERNVTYSPTSASDPGFSSCSAAPERFSHVMQQSGRGNSLYGSRVSSPSLTLDSGRGSSSAPSSPAKEMSPVSNIASSNLQASPSFSRKITKPQQDHVNLTNQKGHTVGGSGDLRQNYSAKSLEKIRKDSLEEEINNAVDKIMFPQSGRPPSRNSVASAVINDFEADLSVPNEIFDDHLEPKLKEMESSEASTSFKQDGMSRPRSFSGGSLNGIAPNAPSPLYGTPQWWPQEENYSPNDDNDDEHDEPPSVSQIIRGDCSKDVMANNLMEKLSVHSESIKSVDSDSQSDPVATEGKKYEPMAFTVDFDDGPKKFGIAEPLSKFVPRHRRNLSSTKTDDLASKKEKDDSSRKEFEPLPMGLTRLGLSSSVSTSDIKASTITSTSKNSKLSSELKTEGLAEKSRKPLPEFPSRLSRPKPILSSSLFSSREQSSIDEASEIRRSDLPSKYISKAKPMQPKSDSKRPMEKSNTPNYKPVVLDLDKEDASSETGTYTIEKDNPDVEKARENIDNVFGTDNKKDHSKVTACDVHDSEQPVGSGAPEWVREWAEQAAQQHKKVKDLNPLTDTQLFLQETENVVSAMQERVTRNLSNNNSSHNSDSDDEATLSQSPPKIMNKSRRPISNRTSPLPREASVLSDSGYQIGYQSDSSNEGLREYKNIGAKMNKAFNIRRGRVVGYESDSCAATALNRHSLTLPVRGISPRPPVGSVPAANTSFARNDGGRYSLRMPKSRTPPNQMAPPIAKPRASPAPGPRTTSSCSSKVDFNANRKSTPQMSGVNTRKPPTGSRSNSTLTAKEVELANWKRRKSYDPMRAAAEGRKKRETMSAIETSVDDVTPTSLSKHSAAVMSKSMSFQMENNFNSKCNSEEEDMIYVVDEMDSSHSNSPIHIPMSRGSHDENNYYGHGLPHPALRPKNKLEALDNLVIATIHSLSNKVRTSSRQLLEKLQMQHADNENGALLEEMVSQLKELEMSSNGSSPNKSPSRELSGTLKNLKKLEQVILVLDRVLCDDSGSDINT